ncbi:hypothetical protein [Microbacterium sp. H1-D42]|uniref:hypothetical protein n=1 Tax=Microbacterium sp. H1-D42 TaxID=2925844 RepID=UPI001F53A7A5|nr:hypothetical protein [Microbacterium sp. H1-D42]UNK71412.1 hypothetical protein MNR00_02855 [Microbacterium sp. H1-D42]
MTGNTGRPVSRADGFGLGLIATGAVSVGIAALVAVIKGAFEVFGSEVAVRMPVTGGAVSSLAGVDGIRSADYSQADVTFTTLSAGARWMLLLEGALPALATIGVCAVAWWLGVSLIRGRAFRKTMSTTIGIAACLVVAGGMFGQLCGAIGRAMIVDRLGSDDPSIYDTFAVFSIDLDLAPLGWGFALALIAMAFATGQRMQRDTEGLV